jgi:hypothetical protein
MWKIKRRKMSKLEKSGILFGGIMVVILSLTNFLGGKTVFLLGVIIGSIAIILVGLYAKTE